MKPEPDLKCPKCGELMEVLMPTEATEPPPDLPRVCPCSAMLAWNNEDGTVEARIPREVKHESRGGVSYHSRSTAAGVGALH